MKDLKDIFLSSWDPTKEQKKAQKDILDTLGATRDVVMRGGVGGLLGAPADLYTALENAGKMAYGVGGHKSGLLSADQLPEVTESPRYGSEWFGQKMQKAGLVSDKRRPLLEVLAGFASPDAVDIAKVPAIFAGVKAAWANLDKLAQSRLGMNAAQRAASYPIDMFDVPVQDQIVSFGNGGV